MNINQNSSVLETSTEIAEANVPVPSIAQNRIFHNEILEEVTPPEKLPLTPLTIRSVVPSQQRNTHTVSVTPDLARQWLKERNDSNRKFRQANFKFLKDQMLTGQFQPRNGQSILFSQSGRLLDGQHRLKAIVESNKTYLLDIKTNVPDEAFTTIDTGAKRSIGDIFDTKGIAKSSGVANSVNMYLKFSKNPLNMRSGVASVGFTVKDALEAYEENSHLFQEMFATATKFTSKFAAIPVTSVASLMVYTSLHSQYKDRAMEEFWKPLFTGAGMSPQVNVLHNRLIHSMNKKTEKTTIFAKVAWVVKSYNYHFRGMQITTLRYDKKEAFPKFL